MAKNNNLLIGGIALIAGLLLFTKNKVQAFANSIAVVAVRYRNLKVTFRGITLDVEIDVQNPTSLPLPYEKITGTVFYNNSIRLGTISTAFAQRTIAPGQVGTATVQLTVKLLDLAANIVSQIQNGFDFPDMRIQGTVFSNNIGFPFNKSILKVG